MKKVLLATTALFLTAGVASAEITFAGKAGAGIFKAGKTAAVAATKASTDLSYFDVSGAAVSTTGAGASGKQLGDGDFIIKGTDGTDAVAAKSAADHYSVYSGIDIDMTASTTADNGMTFTAATDIGAGYLLDAGDRELDAQGTEIGTPKVSIGYQGVTVSLKSEGHDSYYDADDAEKYDIGVAGSFGDLSYGLVMDTDRKGGGSDYSATFGISVSGVSMTLNTEEVDGADDKTAISVAYSMGDLKATLKADNKGADKDVASLTLAYTAGPATLTLSAANDKDNAKNTNKGKRGSWDATVAYTTGAYTINATTNESDAWNANVNYDLGGGASMVVGADSTETSFAGVSFAF
jgi:outer membrane protein OmpU